MPNYIEVNTSRGPNDIKGAATGKLSFTVTASTDTTVAIPKVGLAFGPLCNPSAGSVSVEFHFCLVKGGTIYRLYDEDGGTTDKTIPAGSGLPIPSAAGGVPILIIKRVSGDDVEMEMHLER